MTVQVHDPRPCRLGEGPLWHPRRNQLFWFDILGNRLLSRQGEEQQSWHFDDHVSAAGWHSVDELLIADACGLFLFNLNTQERRDLCALEADNPITRSNDGRADPWGGFWIGTMGKGAEPGAGSIYRYYQGKLTRLFGGITIPNSICFSPDRLTAYFSDTITRKIMRQALDTDGWPEGQPKVFVDLSDDNLNPDGSVVDAAGCLWNAQWGAARVARYSPEGGFMSAIEFPARQISCPAFGGNDLQTLFATSAWDGIEGPDPAQGQTLSSRLNVKGQSEHRVILRAP